MNNAGLGHTVVLVAAWWHVHIVSSISTAIYDPVWSFGKLFWPEHAQRFAGFLELKLLPFLLLDWLAWPVACNYLQAKWQVELDEQNRSYARRKL